MLSLRIRDTSWPLVLGARARPCPVAEATLSAVWKPILFVALLLGSVSTAWATGLFDHLTLDTVRSLVEEAGWWGPVLLIALFGLEGLGVVPAFPFLLTAVAVWPPAEALVINMIGAITIVPAFYSIIQPSFARGLMREEDREAAAADAVFCFSAAALACSPVPKFIRLALIPLRLSTAFTPVTMVSNSVRNLPSVPA